jgi:hypothetical protein
LPEIITQLQKKDDAIFDGCCTAKNVHKTHKKHEQNNTKFFKTTGHLDKFYKKAVQQTIKVP